MKTFVKDPNAVKDYTVKWMNWLSGDSISSSTFITESGLTIDSESNDTESTTVWLSGGSDGQSVKVTNRIVTAGGRTEDRSFLVKVQEQ